MTPNRRRTLLAGIRRDLSTPPKLPRPTTSPPPPLATRPDPVQLWPSLHWNCLHPDPPLTGAARARPPAHPGTQHDSPSPTGAHVHARSPCSPAFHRERRRAATAAAPPRR
jgi:hypothetical protein